MPNLNQLIINSATCSIAITIPTAFGTKSFPLLTVQSFDFNATASGELIYAIGTREPIGNQSNENKYDGKITIQLGEINAILGICGLSSAIQIQNAQISVAALTGGFVRVYSSANCNSDTTGIRAKDKETLTSLDWLAISVGP
jgi:hypothetical protein